MLSESLKKKVQFVKEISDAVVKVQPNVIGMSYEVYQSKKNPKWITEFLIINYDGGAMSVRNCTATSCSGIFKEIAKMLEHGYYDELDYYTDIINSDSELISE